MSCTPTGRYLVIDVFFPRSEDVLLDPHLGPEGLLRREVEHVVVSEVIG